LFKKKSFPLHLLVFLIPIIIINIATCSFSKSLWSDKSNSSYTAVKAHKPGDVLVVLIEEQTNALQSGSTQSDKNSSVQLDFSNSSESKLDSVSVQNDGKLALNFQGGQSYSGTGRTQRNSTVKATLTAVVIDVQPNGNLFIMGQRQLHINNEVQQLEVSGIVRPDDISPQNTVLSSRLANAKVSIKGSGPVSSPQKTGLFGSLFGWLF
jgi:flagellar L-ring protein FlgH